MVERWRVGLIARKGLGEAVKRNVRLMTGMLVRKRDYHNHNCFIEDEEAELCSNSLTTEGSCSRGVGSDYAGSGLGKEGFG